MATTFNWIYLGQSSTFVDPTEGNSTMENPGAFTGQTFGTAGTPLYLNRVQATTLDLGGTSGALDTDNTVVNDQIATTINGNPVTLVYDGLVVYNTTVTYVDGTTANVTAVFVQTTSGDIFLAPELLPLSTDGVADTAAFEAKPIRSITFNSTNSFTNTNLGADRQVTGWDDGLVDGTAAGDLINAAYVEPIALGSDRIDNNDGLNAASMNDDRIRAGGGNDTVLAGVGNDTIYGGTGDDSLSGEGGSDTVLGEDGSDRLFGGDGTDLLNGGIGLDVLFGDAGNDTLYGDAGADLLYGGNDADLAYGGADNDTLFGDAGNDTLFGDANADLLFGGDNSDLVYGGTESDTLYGDAGNDALFGDAGDDRLYGGLSDDLLNGGLGLDVLTGDAGNDTLYGDVAADLLYGGNDADLAYGGADNDTLFGDAGNDTLYGDVAADLLYGGNDADLAYGGADNDTLFGDAGSDTLFGDENADLLFGGNDADQVYGGTENDTLYGDAGNDTLFGDDGSDRLFGGTNADVLNGGLGADVLTGDAGTDTLFGDAGNDTIFGGNQADLAYGGNDADVIYGGADQDTLFGGAANDTVFGDIGNDVLYGGAGTDSIFAGDDRDQIFVNYSGPLNGPLTTNDILGNETVDGGSGGTDNDTLTLDVTGLRWDRAFRLVYDPGNAENGTITFFNLDGVTVIGTLRFTEIENVIIICFTTGTQILTERGPVRVEDLVPGDLVVTRDHGLQPLRWVGTRQLSYDELVARPHLQPVRIAAGALQAEGPERSILVSPQHRVLMEGARAEMYFGEPEVLVPAKHLTDLAEVTRALPPDGVTYVHILFDRHEIVQSEGIWTESFQPAERTLGALDEKARAEVLELFPELAIQMDSFPAARLSLNAHEAKVLVSK